MDNNKRKATFTLTKEVKDKWVAALRSGDYRQGKHRLKQIDGSYCCLGVLQIVTDGKVENIPGYDVSRYMPSDSYKLRVFGDADAELAVLFGLMGEVSLSELNDDRHLSFDKIADLIEEQVETR